MCGPEGYEAAENDVVVAVRVPEFDLLWLALPCPNDISSKAYQKCSGIILDYQFQVSGRGGGHLAWSGNLKEVDDPTCDI